jgi:hypothetical protein
LAKDRENPKWTYERGEGRYKHRWNNDYPGFEPRSKGPVGKCPKSIDEKLATEILNDGVPYFDSQDQSTPAKIYCVYLGAVYELVPTQPGVSWHGYPWRGDLAGRAPLPRKIKRQLEEKAEKSGFLKEYTSWMKSYG